MAETLGALFMLIGVLSCTLGAYLFGKYDKVIIKTVREVKSTSPKQPVKSTAIPVTVTGRIVD